MGVPLTHPYFHRVFHEININKPSKFKRLCFHSFILNRGTPKKHERHFTCRGFIAFKGWYIPWQKSRYRITVAIETLRKTIKLRVTVGYSNHGLNLNITIDSPFHHHILIGSIWFNRHKTPSRAIHHWFAILCDIIGLIPSKTATNRMIPTPRNDFLKKNHLRSPFLM